jgi:hypothetical protein
LCDKGEVLTLEDFVSRFSLDCIPKENCILTKFPIVS